jgi:hypothetical protein
MTRDESFVFNFQLLFMPTTFTRSNLTVLKVLKIIYILPISINVWHISSWLRDIFFTFLIAKTHLKLRDLNDREKTK